MTTAGPTVCSEEHMKLLWTFKDEALEERSVEEYVKALQDVNFPVNAKTTTLMKDSPLAFASGRALCVKTGLAPDVIVLLAQSEQSDIIPIFPLSPNVVKALVQLGADPNQPNDNGGTAIGEAVSARGYPRDILDTVQFLLSLPNIKVNHLHDGKQKMTALHLAVEACDERCKDEVLDLLLEHPDIDVLIKNGKGDTPLDAAVAQGDKYAVTQLEEAEQKQRERSSASSGSGGSAWTGGSNNELKTLVLLLAETVANLPHVDEKISGRIRQIAHKLK